MKELERIRKLKGMTQIELSEMLNVERTTVTKWETGKANPRSDKLLKLAEIFGCTVDELLREEK